MEPPPHLTKPRYGAHAAARVVRLRSSERPLVGAVTSGSRIATLVVCRSRSCSRRMR